LLSDMAMRKWNLTMGFAQSSTADFDLLSQLTSHHQISVHRIDISKHFGHKNSI